jgi:DELLA protein
MELASMGYSVKSSELAQVAYKLEQLEMMMCNGQEDGIISHLSSEAVHYNPSDLGGWIESMLSELHAPVPPPADQPFQFPQAAAADQSSTAREASNSVPESSTSTSKGARSMQDEHEQQYRVNGSGAGVGVGLFEPPEVLDRSEFQLHGYPGNGGLRDNGIDRMFGNYGGLFSQVLDLSDLLVDDPDVLPEPPQEASPSTLLLQSSSNSSLEVQSGREHLDEDVTGREQKRYRVYDPELPERPVVVMGADPHESGVRLVHTLMACAEAVQRSNFAIAREMVKEVRILASAQGGAMSKVATYFAEALARRIYGFLPQDTLRFNQNDPLSDVLQFHFYQTCPYLKFAHFIANQAILDAFSGYQQVHVIDFNLKQGIQWPALIQALALRPGGPPSFRLTGIGPPQPDGTDALQEVGMKLAQLAESINVKFSFRGCVAKSLSDIKPWMLNARPDVEAVAVNSILELHRLLDDTIPGRPSAIDLVLASIRGLNPKIVTVVEQEADHNRPVFLERFTEALHYYSTVFDSLEARGLQATSEEQVMSEVYLGREICNIVACEGSERVERHEPLLNWSVRLRNAGFWPMHLGSNAFKQASMLLSLFSGGEGYRVEENNGCLTLGWHSRPLIAASAWQCYPTP